MAASPIPGERMSDLKAFKIRIDDLPEEIIYAIDHSEFSEKLSSVICGRKRLQNVGDDVNLQVTWPDGSTHRSTLAQHRPKPRLADS
jgi:hypothetical protein